TFHARRSAKTVTPKFREWHSGCDNRNSIPTRAVSKENRLRRWPEPVESFREAQPRYRFFFFFFSAAFLAFFAGFFLAGFLAAFFFVFFAAGFFGAGFLAAGFGASRAGAASSSGP